MIKNKFCLVGVDMDFDSLISKYKTKFVGFFQNLIQKNTQAQLRKLTKKIL